MVQKMTFDSKSAEETQEFGKSFASQLKPGDVVALYGELGSGKTTFVQGLAKGLGIARRIISPTFIIVRTYGLFNYSSSDPPAGGESRSSSRQARTINFYHIDLYRVENEKDLESVGIKEILHDQDAIVAIEWAEKMGSLLPKKRLEVYCKYLGNNVREILTINF